MIRIICLTPCRNEGWVINNHLKAASTWADSIVLGDQMSDDDTREIIHSYAPKAILCDNYSRGYDEGERHRVVFEKARQLYPGERKVLLAIDSDEMLSANWRESPEWEKIKELPPGSGIYAKWININPDFKTWFPLGGYFIIGVVDDGRLSYSSGQFHVPRLVQDSSKPMFFLNDIRLLHFQYVDSERQESKRRAYHVQEWILNPHDPILLFRRLNPLRNIRSKDIKPMDPRWTAGFAQDSIEWNSVRRDGLYRWDKLCLESFATKGTHFFSRLDIWNPDWPCLAIAHGMPAHDVGINDPRSMFEKIVHQFLRVTQPFSRSLPVRFIQLMLRPFGW